MNRFVYAALLVAVPAAIVVGNHYFFDKPKPETARMICRFDAASDAQALRLADSGRSIARIDLSADLTKERIDDGDTLWGAEATITSGAASAPRSGVVFTGRNGKVRGMAFFEGFSSQRGGDLYITTLNKDGRLDWNETTAYFYHKSSPNKFNHPYRYACGVQPGSAS